MFSLAHAAFAPGVNSTKPKKALLLKDCPRIHEAIGKGDHEALESIIASHSAEVLDQRTLNGNHSPLHTAVACQKADCLKILITSGAPLNSINAKGLTPLHLAIQLEQTGTALTLIAAGANCSALDGEGCTPLSLAMSTNNPIIVQAIMDKGVELTKNDVIVANTMKDAEILLILKRNQVFRDLYYCLRSCLAEYQADFALSAPMEYHVPRLNPYIFIEYFQNILHQLCLKQTLVVPTFTEEKQSIQLTYDETQLKQRCDAIFALIKRLPIQHQEKGLEEFSAFLLATVQSANKDYGTAKYLAEAIIGEPSRTVFFKREFVLQMEPLSESDELDDDFEVGENISSDSQAGTDEANPEDSRPSTPRIGSTWV